MDRGRAPVVIDGATGRVERVSVRVKRPRRDPVKERNFAAELEREAERFFDAQRQRAFDVVHEFERALAGTLKRAMKG